MRDFVTNAYTLRVIPSRDHDKVAHLFTEEFGRIEARVVSGRKPLSKFSPHLEPMQRVVVRLAKRKGFTLTDVLSEPKRHSINDVKTFGAGLRVLSLIYSLSPREVRDEKLWDGINSMFYSNIFNPREIIALLGFHPNHATCGVCGAQFIVGFHVQTHEFVCIECASKFSESNIIIL